MYNSPGIQRVNIKIYSFVFTTAPGERLSVRQSTPLMYKLYVRTLGAMGAWASLKNEGLGIPLVPFVCSPPPPRRLWNFRLQNELIPNEKRSPKQSRAQPPCASRLTRTLFALCKQVIVWISIFVLPPFVLFYFYTTVTTEAHHARIFTHVHFARFKRSFLIRMDKCKTVKSFAYRLWGH